MQLFVSLTHDQREKLKEYLHLNGYHLDWEEEDDVLDVDVDEVEYVKTILHGMGIYYTDDPC